MTSSIYNSFGNLIQMKVCASSGSSNKHLAAPDVRSVLLPEKKKLIAAGARADIAGLALLGLRWGSEGDIHCLCLIRASRMGWDSLLFDGEHCYEDGQSLCSLSETIV